MGTKREPGKFDCFEKAKPDEPVFTLLARDDNASHLVDAWATRRERQIQRGEKPATDIEQVEEARRCAREMRLWRSENLGAPLIVRPLETAPLGDRQIPRYTLEQLEEAVSIIPPPAQKEIK